MLVKDSYIQFLNQNGYNPIAVPRESIRPLSVLINVEHDQVRKVGSLADYIEGAFNPPEMDAVDEYVSWASKKGTDRLQASIGIPFLSQFLSRFITGGSSVSASIGRANGIDLTFGTVLRDGIGINSLRLLLERSHPTTSRTLSRDIDTPGTAYIVTDILKSREFLVKTYHSSKAKGEGQVGGVVNASFGNEEERVLEHAIHGERPLPFAFRAVGFSASEGKFADVDLVDKEYVLMGPVTEAMVKYAVVAPGALLELP
jgi:hypothetical protein